MNIRDFEPVNGGLLSRKMLNGNDYTNRNNRVPVKRIIKPQQPIMKIQNNMSSFDGEAKYPLEDEKKMFGMKPKTVVLALGVIVVSILIMNMFGVDKGEMPQNTALPS